MTVDFHFIRHRRERGGRRRLAARALAAVLFAAVIAVTFAPTAAQAWWNDDWQLRKQITLDTSAAGANITDPIGTTPVLVRLHSGNFRFSAAKDDGSDLRFVAEDDKTPLKYHIEKYDSLLGEALIWVAVPDIKPGAKTEFWLYYGNKKAVTSADAKGTYDADTLLVYHFNERGTPALDSSVWANNAQSVGKPADDALIGNGVRLDGQTSLTLPASPSLTFAANAPLTWSAWIEPAALLPNAVLYSRRSGGDGLLIGLDNGVPFVEVDNAGATQRSGTGAPITVNGWHHIAVVANNGQIALYLDGNSYATLAAALPALNTPALIGGDTPTSTSSPVAPASASPDASTPAPATSAPPGPASTDGTATPNASSSAAGGTAGQGASPAASPDAAATSAPAPAAAVMVGFIGDIDELRIAKVAQSPGVIKFAAIEEGTDPAKLISFTVDEETASWLSGYIGVILKSVTIDGWVVIGLLLIMAVISWVVMVDKATFLNRQAKANRLFLQKFRAASSDLTVLDFAVEEASTSKARAGADDGKAILPSSLYRVYQIGAVELGRRFARNDGQPAVLSGPAIAAIRAALDGGVVKEMQRLNRLMVVLTIAISGGPFLGLLGTVVGVMITFAAIAASGDVNVNAIAPGIAAALVATVAGLAVAIPALFGYNYLISQIKDLSDDIQVFVDEFVTRMAELYSADRPDPVAHRMAAE
jgi:biopolymer transport protein ExbB